jgi:uncharacterized protein YkwD
MSTQSSARRHTASSRPQSSARRHPPPGHTQPAGRPPASEPWDPHYTPPSQVQPPWGDRPPGPLTGNQYPAPALLAGDTDPGPAPRADGPNTGSTLLPEPSAPRSPRRLGDPLPAEPRPGDSLTAEPRRLGDPLPSELRRGADPLSFAPSRAGDSPTAAPRRLGDPLPGEPTLAGDPPPRSPRRGDDRPPWRPRRARYLVAVLLALVVLGGSGYYLVSGSGPATPVTSGTNPTRPAPTSCGPGAGAAGSAVSGALAGAVGTGMVTRATAAPCGGQPFGYVTARPSSPQSPRSRPSHRQPGHPVTGGPSSSPSGSTPSSSAAAPSSSSPSASSPAGTSSSSAADQVLALINQARSSAGLAPLTISSGLVSSASAHNATMAGGCGLSHQCPGEPDLGARETTAGVHWTAAGENIGEGGPVADSSSAIAQMAAGLTQDMLNEKPPNDGHRQNILSSTFTHIGIAVFRDPSGTVWLTQDFSN